MDSNHRPHAYQACALTRLSYRPLVSSTRRGGPDRVRTDDLLDANQALSQLSYGPHFDPSHTSQTPRCSGRLGKPDKYRVSFETQRMETLTMCFLLEALLRKEVIQPQVLLQLPCYDFTPITKFTIET